MKFNLRFQQSLRLPEAAPARGAAAKTRFSSVGARAGEWWRLAKAVTGWPWPPEQWVTLSAFALAVVIGVWLATIHIGWGDYGQWLMVSRAYLGQDVPDYRDISSIPPVAPFLIAVLKLIFGDPVLTLQVFKGVLGVGLAASVFFAGKQIYRRSSAGLLATVFAMLVTDRMLELFAFGGLPQLTALIFWALGVGLLAKAAATGSGQAKWWALGFSAIGLAALSHVGTGVVAAFSAGIITLTSLAIARPRDRYQWTRVIIPGVIVAAILAAYYFPILLPANEQYGTNPASSDYRGPDTIFTLWNLYYPNWILVVISVFFLAGQVQSIYQHRKLSLVNISLAWTLGAWAFLLIAVLANASTDYPRFSPVLLLPMSVAAGGGMALTAAPFIRLLQPVYQRAGTAGIPIFLGIVLVIAVGIDTIGEHRAEARYYSLPTLGNVRDIASWLDDYDSQGHTVVAPTREGKWIEGLTGRETLIDIPGRFSFREAELDRSIANQTLLKSTGALANEQFFLKFTESKPGPNGAVPTSMWVAANHGGEYLDLLRMPTTNTRIFTGGGTADVLATLGALDAASMSTDELDDFVRVTTDWAGARRGSQVGFTRRIELSDGANDFTVTDTASSSLASVPVSGIQVEVWPLTGVTVQQITINGSSATISFMPVGSRSPVMTVSSDDPGVVFTTTDNKLIATTAGDMLSLRYTLAEPGQPLHSLAYLDPAKLVDEYNIGYVMLDSGDASAARAARLATVGFGPVYQSGPYTVLGLEGPFLTTTGNQPGGTGNDGQTPVTGQPTPTPTLPDGFPTPQPTPVLSGSPDDPAGTPGPSVTATAQPTRVPTPTATATPVPQPPAELIDAALWVDQNIPQGSSLLAATADDGAWLEALSGLRTLSLGVISAGQDAESLEGSLAVEALLRSTTTLVNENFALKFVDSKPSTAGDVPLNLWAAANVDGQYTALMRMLPTETKVMAGPGDVLATLGALSASAVEVSETADEIRITTTWTGDRRGGTVNYKRTVVLDSNARYFDVIDEVSGTAPIAGIDVTVEPPVGVTPVNVTAEADRASVVLPASLTPSKPFYSITSEDEGTQFIVRGTAVGVVSATPNSLHMRFSVQNVGLPIAELHSLVPADLIGDFNVQAVFLRRDGAFPAREKRLNGLGFTTAAEFGSLVVMTREGQ